MRARTAVVFVVCVAALAAVFTWHPVFRILAESRIEAVSGCAVRIAGCVSVRPSFEPELRLADVELAVRPGGSLLCDARSPERASWTWAPGRSTCASFRSRETRAHSARLRRSA